MKEDLLTRRCVTACFHVFRIGMSARWPAQGTPPGSQGRLVAGSATPNPEVQAIVRLVKSDQDFRNELKNVIAEALQPDLEKLRSELLSQMSASNAAAASSNVPPPMDHEAIIQRDFPGAVLEEWSFLDEQGSVYGFAETVSSHIIRHNNMAYLCDIKEVRLKYLAHSFHGCSIAVVVVLTSIFFPFLFPVTRHSRRRFPHPNWQTL